ncbi:MAG: hypothetical protein EZS28_016377 [Streblomastix strix]|uniref:Uncharacterized protein n=1 Tax=Streblomastix strix TaxID=222440 RepID=A0A5J4VZL3_9EUKA|nr:MAG: hypothetical protein EZS28_016377 [Streblomastix strix]
MQINRSVLGYDSFLFEVQILDFFTELDSDIVFDEITEKFPRFQIYCDSPWHRSNRVSSFSNVNNVKQHYSKNNAAAFHSHDNQEFRIDISISALRQAKTGFNIQVGFLADAQREVENSIGNMVAEFIPYSIVAAVTRAKEERLLSNEAPARETNIRTPQPSGLVSSDQFIGIQ